MAVITAIFTILMRKQIALLYNDNPEVVLLASQLMLLAAIYQISDSVQVIGSGILRGYKDTRSIFFITFTAYWVLGLPSGYLLALNRYACSAYGARRFLVRIYYRAHLGSSDDDAADAFPAASTVQRDFATRGALTHSGTCSQGAAPHRRRDSARAQRGS
ncbi:Multidrug-efflux transporter [Raoultella planticola]|uniref:Multidrug-efflux transporter n=1 Tax=Raoultella planticola TaxID=575 RepID=A0A485CYS2_RAOPL|nr:Multidrug-efflux transporter [Raoultella planticola]